MFRPRWVMNLLAVWALTGIWHGANYTFLAWGLFYFVLLIMEKFTRLPERLGRLSHIYALVAIMVGWVMFRSDNLGAGLQYLSVMFGFSGLGLTDDFFYMYLEETYVLVSLAIFLSLPVLPWLKEQQWTGKAVEALEPVAAFGIFLLTLAVTVSASYNPFIYFNF